MNVESSGLSGGLNADILSKAELVDLVSREDILTVLEEFSFDWEQSRANTESELFRVFDRYGWTVEEDKVNRLGRLIYSRLALHFDEKLNALKEGALNYKVVRKLRSGKNSIVFEAQHLILGFKVVLKIIRPGASDNLASSLRAITESVHCTNLVLPSDIFDLNVVDILGKSVKVKCLVFPFIQHQSFSDFIRSDANHYNSHVVTSFIDQVGSQLEELEKIGAYHGDLHAENILVDNLSPSGLRFILIDLSYDAVGSMSLEMSRNNDLRLFKQHIWAILSSQKAFIPNVSLRKFVGTEYYEKITLILSDKVDSFSQAMSVFRNTGNVDSFLDRKNAFLDQNFSIPKSFRLQRYEEFTDPSIASKLFVPFPDLEEKINDFGNVFVSGNRGSGKSTYLASLAFFPSVEKPIVDFRSTFGIYFACRQGEYKTLGPKDVEFSTSYQKNLQHLIVLKVVRKTLQLILEAVDLGLVSNSSDYSALALFLDEFIPNPGIIRIEESIISDFENIVTTISRVELDNIRTLNGEIYPVSSLLTPFDLIKFFGLIKQNFTELLNTKFHILYDDVGEPYVHKNVQKTINELIISSNPTYCVKLTAEKNTYSFQTTGGKALENGHDYSEQDITYMLYIGSKSGGGVDREKLERYFREIVNQRLIYFGYQSSDIREYLGDNADSAGRLITLLAYGRKDAYYYGWNTVWNVADRTPRNLLELVSEIFSIGEVETDSIPKYVSIRNQDRGIKTVSEKRLQSLSQIPGSIMIGGDRVSLGRKLFDVTITIGSTFRTYLKAERRGRYNKNSKRVRQHLAIERNDMDNLHGEAQQVLDKLVTYGILDPSRSAVARDDGAKKPIYVLNRIYCPAFEIGYQRDDHLKLSRGKFESLLLAPHIFLANGTKKLIQYNIQTEKPIWNVQSDLFVTKVDEFEK